MFLFYLKRQIVIPQTIREKAGLTECETLTVTAEDKLIVLKKIANPIDAEDLRILNEIKGASKELANGQYKKMSSEEFLKEISKW